MKIQVFFLICTLIFNNLQFIVKKAAWGVSANTSVNYLAEKLNFLSVAQFHHNFQDSNPKVWEISQSNPDEIETLSERIRLNPNDAEAYQQRGMIYAYKEDFQNAIKDYNQSLHLDPNSAQTYNYRGTAYYWLENYPQALEDFNQALRLNQNFTLAYYNRAYVHQKLGNKQAAIDDFQKGADLSLQQGDLTTYQQALEMIKELEQ